MVILDETTGMNDWEAKAVILLRDERSQIARESESNLGTMIEFLLFLVAIHMHVLLVFSFIYIC